MRNDREERLQQRAYEIWEAEGCPEGRDIDHWIQAERELAVPLDGNNITMAHRANGPTDASLTVTPPSVPKPRAVARTRKKPPEKLAQPSASR